MDSKLSIVLLGFLGLFVIAQGFTIDPEEIEKDFKCWTHDLCYSDGNSEIIKCTNSMKYEDIKKVYEFVNENYYKYESDNALDAVKEYCNYNNAQKKDAYDKTLNGIVTYFKNDCKDSDKEGICSGLGQALGCAFLHLSMMPNDQCTIDG